MSAFIAYVRYWKKLLGLLISVVGEKGIGSEFTLGMVNH